MSHLVGNISKGMAGILHVWPRLIDHVMQLAGNTSDLELWYKFWPFSEPIDCMYYDKADIFIDNTRTTI